jgi:hypothetical protein
LLVKSFRDGFASFLISAFRTARPKAIFLRGSFLFHAVKGFARAARVTGDNPPLRSPYKK